MRRSCYSIGSQHMIIFPRCATLYVTYQSIDLMWLFGMSLESSDTLYFTLKRMVMLALLSPLLVDILIISILNCWNARQIDIFEYFCPTYRRNQVNIIRLSHMGYLAASSL